MISWMARSKGGSRFSPSISCAASRQGNSPSRQRAVLALFILLTIPPPPHPACSRACRPHSSIPVCSPSVHTPSGNPPHSCFLSFRCVQSNGRRAFLPALAGKTCRQARSAFMRSRSPMAGTVTAFRVSRTYSGQSGNVGIQQDVHSVPSSPFSVPVPAGSVTLSSELPSSALKLKLSWQTAPQLFSK